MSDDRDVISKKTCVIVGIALAALALILSNTYRSYIYINHIFDFHFADTIGNIFAVPAALFVISGIHKEKNKVIYSIPKIVFAYILYEFMGLTGIHGVFDIYDIIATIISGAVTYFVLSFGFNISKL